jgi:hypothetical protein
MRTLVLPALLLLSACASTSADRQVASNRNICSDGYDVAQSVDPLGQFTVAPRTACRLEVDKSREPPKPTVTR